MIDKILDKWRRLIVRSYWQPPRCTITQLDKDDVYHPWFLIGTVEQSVEKQVDTGNYTPKSLIIVLFRLKIIAAYYDQSTQAKNYVN